MATGIEIGKCIPEPFLDCRGDAFYLVDRDGNTRRIHDAQYTGGRAHRLTLGAATANTRHFVAADGTQRSYTFGRDRRRDTTLVVLLEHVSSAGHCSRERFNPSVARVRRSTELAGQAQTTVARQPVRGPAY